MLSAFLVVLETEYSRLQHVVVATDSDQARTLAEQSFANSVFGRAPVDRTVVVPLDLTNPQVVLWDFNPKAPLREAIPESVL